MRGVKPDFVNEPFHVSQFVIAGSLCSVQVYLVVMTEMILEQPAISGNPVKAQERFSSRDSCAKGAHVLRLLNHLRRDINRVFICKNGVRAFSFTGERAVPAGAGASSRNKEHHLCALMAENTAL
jgi:hypothetical protein